MDDNTGLNRSGKAAAISDQASALSDRLTQWLADQSWVPNGFERTIALAMLVAGLALSAWLIYVVVRPLILHWMQVIVKRTRFSWDDKMFGYGVFRWATHFVPALYIYVLAPGLLKSSPTLVSVTVSASLIYMVIAGYFVVDSLLNAGYALFRKTKSGQKFLTGTFIQVIKLTAALIALILILAIVIGKSPLVLLGGLGMFASILMLVFKDVILGFVAGIQLASNKMLSPGDWLEMPSQGADGDVEEIGLTTVKIRNFDKTITTIPTFALISQSFKNWQGMTESGGRRIKRSLLIDISSIKLADEEMLKRFREIEHIGKHLQKKEEDIAAWNKEHSVSGNENRVNGRRLTNVGTFRSYIEAYLKNHPMIHQDGMTLLVRQLPPDGQGLPIEIYCFTTTTAWGEYEAIQADIFDHFLAVAQEFDLRIYQQPSGNDLHDLIAGQGEK